MKKTLLILLFFTVNGYSQIYTYDKAEIHFRDGKVEEGYVKILNFKEIKFRTSLDDKPVKFNYKKINKIIKREDGKDVEYQYKIVKAKRKNYPRLMKLVTSGKVSLYITEHKDIVGQNSPLMLEYDGVSYYMVREDSHIAEYVGAKTIAIGRKSVTKGLITYFRDCPNLIEKIENKEFGKKDVIKIIEYYNTHCE